RLHYQDVGPDRCDQILNLRDGMRSGNGTASHAVDVLELLGATRAGRFDAHESAVRFDAGVGSVLQPAQRIRAAGEVSEGGFNERTFPESFVETFSESTKRERIAQNQNFDTVLRCGGLVRE